MDGAVNHDVAHKKRTRVHDHGQVDLDTKVTKG